MKAIASSWLLQLGAMRHSTKAGGWLAALSRPQYDLAKCHSLLGLQCFRREKVFRRKGFRNYVLIDSELIYRLDCLLISTQTEWKRITNSSTEYNSTVLSRRKMFAAGQAC